MFKQLKAVGTIYENYMIRRGRVEAYKILLTQDEKTLDDIGISRHELSGGIKNWPWDGSAGNPQLVDQSSLEMKAIHELNQYSDRELHDIGIDRGMIRDAVKNGRVGIDDLTTPRGPSKTAEKQSQVA